jgi:hypothetical protein
MLIAEEELFFVHYAKKNSSSPVVRVLPILFSEHKVKGVIL